MHRKREKMSATVVRRPYPSIFRGTFCIAKHTVSCIPYLSKTHFVRDFPQKLQVELDQKKTELRVRFPSKTEKQMQPQLVKTKLLCETSLLWDFFAVRLLLLWNFFALRLLCSETPLLWDFLRNSVPLKYRLPNFTWQISICFFGMLFASWRAQKIKVSNLFCFATSVACRKSIGTCGIVGMLYGRAW
jgi:hypothetical protein